MWRGRIVRVNIVLATSKAKKANAPSVITNMRCVPATSKHNSAEERLTGAAFRGGNLPQGDHRREAIVKTI